MEYYYEYLEYKRKYIYLRDSVLNDLQVGGGFLDGLSKWFRGKEEPKISTEPTHITIYPPVKQTLGKKTVAEWLYNSLKDKPPREPFKVKSIILDQLDKKVSEDMYHSMTQYYIDKTITPKKAYEYLLNANGKMNRQYIVDFLYNYINFAIKYGPDKFKKDIGNSFNTESDYMIPMIKLLLMYREYGMYELDDTIQKFKKTAIDYEADIINVTDEYKKWVETLLDPGTYMPEIEPNEKYFGRMAAKVDESTLVKRPSSLQLPAKVTTPTPLRPASMPPAKSLPQLPTIKQSPPPSPALGTQSSEQQKQAVPMSSYRKLPTLESTSVPATPFKLPPLQPLGSKAEQELLPPTFQAPTPPSSPKIKRAPLGQAPKPPSSRDVIPSARVNPEA